MKLPAVILSILGAAAQAPDARWFDIDSDAKLNGASLGTVEIDPYAFGLSIGRRF